MRLTIRVTKNPGETWAYTGQCVEIPGAISDGRTRAECIENTLSAVRDIVDARRKEARAQLKRSRASSKPKLVTVDA